MLTRLVTVLAGVAVAVALAAAPASAVGQPTTHFITPVHHTPMQWRQILTGWPHH